MKIYAIKNIKTGLYLSNGKAMARTKASFSEIPRLFNKKQAASSALNCWLLGVWHNHIDFEGQLEGPCPPDKTPDDRNNMKEDLKIVEADVEFRLCLT